VSNRAPLTAVRAIKVRPDRRVELPEHLATEEPMEIRAAGPGQEAAPVAVTMRTPGNDFELAVGFLVTEGLVRPSAISSVSYCEAVTADEERYNTVTVHLGHPWSPVDPRHFAATASCGICGKATIDQVELACPIVGAAEPVPASLIPHLPEHLRQSQRVFDRTGGLHAAGLFDRSGSLVCVREDVGRHNAVDKVVGHAVLSSVGDHDAAEGVQPLAGGVLVVSGRVSFEIVQKAAMAGISVVAAISAPSSLAVAAAERLGVAIAAFVRDGSFNLYSHPERLDFDA
jgi:FdhD protein